MVTAEGNTIMELPSSPHYFYDSNHTRYELYSSNGAESYNWLFLPGGPGADSSYLHSLVDTLDLPGNVWLIDLPGNGSNIDATDSENFDKWFEIFLAVIQKFDDPILVGHSFGGMFPLLFPELEDKLKGFIILNSSPSLWLEEAVEYSRQFDLPDLSEEMADFTQHPSQQTFEVALDACMPYYFPKETLKKGRELLLQIPFQYLPAVWWQKKAIELNFSAKWVPQKVPTLIVGSKYDCICPYTLFKKDERFQRSNIEFLFLENAGHCGWLESPQEMKAGFKNFSRRLNLADKPNTHTVVVILESKQGKEELLKNALIKVAEKSRCEDSCLEYRFYQDDGNPLRFALHEKWKSKELHQLQFSKPYILDFAKETEGLLEKPFEAVFGKEVTN